MHESKDLFLLICNIEDHNKGFPLRGSWQRSCLMR